MHINYLKQLSIFILLVLASLNVYAQADSFDYYLSRYRKNMNDNDIRNYSLDRMIYFANAMDPAPQVPGNAKEYEMNAVKLYDEFLKTWDRSSAYSKNKYYDKIMYQLDKAIEAAPWWYKPYYDLGAFYEHVKHTRLTIENYEEYLKRNPRAKNEGQIREKIIALSNNAQAKKKASEKEFFGGVWDVYMVEDKKMYFDENNAKLVARGAMFDLDGQRIKITYTINDDGKDIADMTISLTFVGEVHSTSPTGILSGFTITPHVKAGATKRDGYSCIVGAKHVWGDAAHSEIKSDQMLLAYNSGSVYKDGRWDYCPGTIFLRKRP